MDRISTTFFA